MKTTVTEEYDADGHLLKRTTVTDGEPATGGYVGPVSPARSCTCMQSWGSITGRTCPTHGYLYAPTVNGTITVLSDTASQQLAEQVGWTLRSAS